MSKKSYGLEMPDGEIYDIIPPAPTSSVRGGIIADAATDIDTVPVKLHSNGKLVVPASDITLSLSGRAADAKKTGEILNEKFDKNCGSENAGKILSVGTDGQVILKSELEKTIETYYALRRTGKVYQTKIWKYEENPTSDGEKLLDNAGLKFTPSTDTFEGEDDYANIPLFEWVNVNYIRDKDTTARPTAIEGMDNYRTSGAVDVGAMQMSFYWNWDASNPTYDLVTISDTPHPEYGLKPWVESTKEDKTVLPWCIGSKYVSGIASDGKLRSQKNLKLQKNQSHNIMLTEYGKKGEGYTGAGACRNTFQIIFNIIKGATKNSQKLYAGVSNWNFQYTASIESDEKHTYFPLTNAQAANLVVGGGVSVGYSDGAGGIDRGISNMFKYADDVRILKIEPLDDNNKAIYLDIPESVAFSTSPVKVNDTITSKIYISSMHAWSGWTDSVIGRHDGSPVSNTDSKHPYRVQGREYAVGCYIIASDTVVNFQSDYSKKVYVAPKGVKHSNSDTNIRNTYTQIGVIPNVGNGEDWWIGDITVDIDTGAWFPVVAGKSESQGCGDRVYAGGAITSGTRECCQTGGLGGGSSAGSASLFCRYSLSGAGWSFGGCD